jgi:hypothetical protein
LINTMELNIEHDQHAIFLLKITNHKVTQAVYVEFSDRTKAISDIPNIIAVGAISHDTDHCAFADFMAI